MPQEIKAKRRLKDIDFSREDSHIALVHKDQGGPASGANYKLVLKALNKESEPIVKSKVDDTSLEVKEGVSNPVVKQENKEKQMEDNEKFEALQKSFDDNKLMLQKALDEVNALKAEKQEQVVKSKTAKISEFVKDAGHAAAITKAALALEDGKDFDEFVKAVEAIAKAVDKTDLFKETGLQADNAESQVTESAVVKAAKARIAKSVKQ